MRIPSVSLRKEGSATYCPAITLVKMGNIEMIADSHGNKGGNRNLTIQRSVSPVLTDMLIASKKLSDFEMMGGVAIL